MSDVTSWIGLLISAASLIVAILALIKSAGAQREANAAQQRIVEIEEGPEQARRDEAHKATLRPELRKTGTHSYRLYLLNHGAAEARNIQVTMDGKALAEHAAAVGNDRMSQMVGPHAEISCLLSIHMGCTPPFDLLFTWDDDSESERSYRTTLTW